MSQLQVKRRVPYVRLGNSGLKVSKPILGCMSYGTSEWAKWVLDEKESIEHIKFAYENGIQTFDTADLYSAGGSEVVLGKAIKQLGLPREEIVVITKVYFVVTKSPKEELVFGIGAAENRGYVNQGGLSRKHIFDSVKASLKRLDMEYIDVLICHRFDYETPIEETMQALHDVVKAGYVRYIGMSSCYAHQFHIMQNYAITHNLTPFIVLENHYNVLYREDEREMMPLVKHFNIGCIPYSPLARGAITRPLQKTKDSTRAGSDALPAEAYIQNKGSEVIVERVEELSQKYGATMAQIAMAWLMGKDGVTTPIIGTTSLDKLKDILGALDVKLTPEDVKYLDEPYMPVNILDFM